MNWLLVRGGGVAAVLGRCASWRRPIWVVVVYRGVKTLADIPGPKQLPLIGNALLFGPLGPYKAERIHEAAADLNRKYGPIVRLKLNLDMVFLFDAKDVEWVFRNDGKHPHRPAMESLHKFRSDRPSHYLRMGLVTDNGADWAYLRALVNPLLRTPVVEKYLSEHDRIGQQFVTYLAEQRNADGVVADTLQHLYKYTQEAIGAVCFDTRLGCFHTDKGNENVISHQVVRTLDAMGKTLLGLPWWKLFPTPTYRVLASTQNAIKRISDELLAESRRNAEKSDVTSGSWLSSLLRNQDLDARDLSTVVMELYQAGIDATASAIGLTLYHLSGNERAQQRLMAEVDRVCPAHTPLAPAMLKELHYLRACIKESLRLTSPAGGSARILNKNLVLSGYDVPAGVLVIGSHPVMSCSQRYVSDPSQFVPERWSRDQDGRHSMTPFVSLPFGFGVRSCPGMRIAEQEMIVFLVQFFRKYKCQYDGPEVGVVMRLNFLPDKPLNFKILERKDI